MSYVLDTDVFSALMRSDPVAGARLLSRTPDQVFVVQPVLAEVHYGIARLRRSRRRSELERRFETLREALPRALWDDQVSEQFGRVKAELERRGERLDDFDTAIAAHALALDATLATANVRHLGRVSGLRVEDWTTESK